MLATRQLEVDPIITARLPIDRWREGFEAMHQSEAIKAVLLPNGA
jgi:threonine dehydrogenase-like Zn-dependent dehydrogenase